MNVPCRRTRRIKENNMALSTEKDSVIYLLGALQRLVSQVELPSTYWSVVYGLLDIIHKFVEKYGE